MLLFYSWWLTFLIADGSLGCYRPALQAGVDITAPTTSVTECRKTCSGSGRSYSLVSQVGDTLTCSCTFSISWYYPLGDDQCNVPCTSEPGFSCGSDNSENVYSVYTSNGMSMNTFSSFFLFF